MHSADFYTKGSKGWVINIQSDVQIPIRFQPLYCFKFPLLYVSGDQKERADSWTRQSIRISVDLSHRASRQRLQTQNWIIIGVPLVTRIPQPIRICMTLFSTQKSA